METKTGMRSVATFDAIVGFFILVGGVLLLMVADQDLLLLTKKTLSFFHIGLSHPFSLALLDVTEHLTYQQVNFLGLMSTSYAAVRLTEAYGLWYQRRWGAWLAVLLCAFFIPIEIYQELNEVTFTNSLVLILNTWIVAFMMKALSEKNIN
jgi:uncharacterized membrane protein (DUF2068 family)